jgi:hypothetical protein
LTVVFSPAGGGMTFVREVENEMRNFANAGNLTRHNPKPDYLDV